jgi:hypothetical protein
MLFPLTALETAKRIPDVVNTLVDRAKHVAIVRGLNKNLSHGKYVNIYNWAGQKMRTMLQRTPRPIGHVFGPLSVVSI